MENDNLIAGLVRTTAEIIAQVEALQRQLRQLVMDADDSDGAIRILNPDINLTDVRPRPVPPPLDRARSASPTTPHAGLPLSVWWRSSRHALSGA